jgi:dihydrofolate reductase
MGGTNYREWAAYWPSSTDEPVASAMNGMPKYVISNTVTDPEWQNTTVLSGDDIADQIRELKSRDGKDIAMSGSATTVRWLLEQGLVDELHLLVHPVVVGSGRRLFEESPKRALELVSSKTYKNGVLDLVYRPVEA